MTRRISFGRAFPEGLRAMGAVGKAVHESGIEDSLLQLVFTRASQINGCAFCLNMHAVDALKGGERDVRLYLLDAWRETSLYTDRERAALALTEAMTLIAGTHVSDDVYAAAAKQFSEGEMGALMLSIAQINSWNRLMIATEAPPQIE